jgi:hydroxyacylglutathione hydrolase
VERPLIIKENVRWWPSTLWQTTTLEVERDGVRLLVDPGVSPWEVREVAGGRPVHHILITHADWDHVMGIGLLPEATVHAGVLATRRIRSGEATESVCQESREFCIPLEGLDGMRVDEVIEPPAEVAIGPWTATVQPLPGHTDDGIATLLPEEGLLVVGDYLSVLEIPFIYDSPWAYRETLDCLVETIERAQPAHIVIGHGAPHDAFSATRVAEQDRAYVEALIAYADGGGDPERPDAVPYPERGGADDEKEHASNVRVACERAAAR